MGQEEIDRVLSGVASYDDLDDADQGVVRAEWDRRIEEARASLDLEAEFVAEGRAWWVVGDGHGGVVIRHLPDLDPEQRAWIASRLTEDARFESVEVSDDVLTQVEASRKAGSRRSGRPVRREHMDAAHESTVEDGEWPPAFFGAGRANNGRTDNSSPEVMDALLAEGFGRSREPEEDGIGDD